MTNRIIKNDGQLTNCGAEPATQNGSSSPASTRSLGEKNQAFACLDKAYAKHDFFLVFLKTHPWMHPLRFDPRFAALVRKMNFPQK